MLAPPFWTVSWVYDERLRVESLEADPGLEGPRRGRTGGGFTPCKTWAWEVYIV